MLENIFTENGWTFATYKCNGNEYKLSNSHLFDNDVIKKILLMIYSFIVGEKTHGHIIWNEESQYYIFEYELNKMTLVSNEERVFWNWAEETFNNIESFYDKENADIVKLNRPIEIEEKIKFFLSKKYDFMFPKEFVDYLKKYNDSRLDNNVIEDSEYGVIS